MNKSKVTKYKLIDIDISKNIAEKIVGSQVMVGKVKTRSTPTKKSKAKAHAWFNNFIENRFDKLEKKPQI